MQKSVCTVESLYLFSVPYGSNGQPIPGAKYRTVPNCLLFHQTPKGDKQKRTQEDVNAGELAWRPLESDKNGLLYAYEAKLDESTESAAPAPDPDKKSQRRFMVQPGQTKLRVQMLPLSDVNAMMAAWGPQEWKKKIAAILGPGGGLEAQLQVVEVKNIEGGTTIAKGQCALLGLVLPRFRTLLVTFSSKSFEQTSVALERVDRDKDGQLSTKSVAEARAIITESESCVAPFCIPESDIQDGFYRLTFDIAATKHSTISSIGGTWRSTDDPRSSSYELSAHLDFPLKSPLGDMQIVNGDPISLEEWLLQQYPEQYALYRFRSIKDHSKSIEAQDRPEAAPRPGALTIAHIANSATAISKWGHGSLSGSSKADLYWSILDAVKESDLIQKDKDLGKAVNLALSSKGLRDKFTDPTASYNQIRELARQANSNEGFSALYGWFEKTKKPTLGELLGYKLELPEDEAYSNTFASRLKINKNHFAQWKRATNVVGKVLSIKQTFDDLTGAWKDIDTQKDLLEEKLGELTAMVRDYHIGLGYLKAEQHQSSSHKNTIKNDQFVRALAKPIIQKQVTLHLNFAHDKWVLEENDVESRGNLKKAHRDIESAGDSLAGVIIEGHTSSPGCPAYNLDLSEKRAETVRKELAKLGVKVPMEVCAYGPSRLVFDASGKEDQAKSRRVVIGIEAYEKDSAPHYLACREAMNMLTLSCDRSIAARLSMQEAWGKLVFTAACALYDIVALILRVIPVTAVAGNAMVLAKEAYQLADAALTTGMEALEVAGIHALNDALQYFNELQGLCNRSTGNHILLRNAAAQYLTPQTEGTESDAAKIRRVNGYMELQLRMRYEAVNGLMGLLKRAANETNSTPEYKDWLEEHKVDVYIQKYLFNDNWLMPTKHFLPLPMDEFWLHNVAHQYIEGKFQNQYVQTLFKSTYDDFQLRKKMINTIRSVNSASHAYSGLYNTIEHSSLPDMAEAHTQRLYPLHYISSKNLEEFYTLLKTDSTEINDQSVAHTAIYYRERKYTENDGWKLVSACRNAATGGWHTHLSPLYPICIVIIMERYETLPSDDSPDDDQEKHFVQKDGKPVPYKDGYYPYTLKQHRYDGGNVEGLSYSGLMKPLTRNDLPDDPNLHHLLKPDNNPKCPPRLGAVIYPFFNYGPVTYQGTRPLVSDNWFKRLHNIDNGFVEDTRNTFLDMRCGFELCLGKNGKYSRPIRVWGEEKDRPRSKKLMADLGGLSMLASPIMVKTIKVMKVVKEAFSPNTFGDEYPVNIDLDRAHLVPGQPDPKTKKIPLITVKDEHLLLDADFLRCGKQDFPYPELFKGNVRTNLLFRFGNSRGQFVGLDPAFFKNWEAHPSIEIRHCYDGGGDEPLFGNRSYLDIRKFDWRESLECAVAVSCDELLTKNYKPTTGSDPMLWQRIPFGMKMEATIKLRDLSTEGPGITASLHYLGYADTHAKQFIKVSGADFEKAELKLAEILSKFASGDEDERARALHILGVSQAELLKTPKRHVYCAYHSFSYQAPTGKKVESLRPFGKGHLIGSKEKLNYGLPGIIPAGIKPGPKNFYFFFSDLQSRGTSGVEKHPWNPEGRDTFLRTPWLFLRINPPPSYLENVPWVEIDSKDQTDANGKTLEDRAAENDRIDMGVAKYAETPAMRWTRLTKEEKTAFIKKWMEDEKMTTE